MVGFVARRLVAGVVQVIMITTLTWILFFVIAGVAGADPAERIAGKAATPAQIEQVRHELGLNRPFPVQYGLYLWHVLHGNLGYSYVQYRSVISLVRPAIGATASLVVVALFIWLALALVLGLFGALHVGTVADVGVRALIALLIAVPVFIVAPLLSYVLAYQPMTGRVLGVPLPGGAVSIFPIDGYVDLRHNPAEWLHHLLLPAFGLALAFAATYARYIRSATLEALDQDYVRTARAKGSSRRRILTRDVGRNVAPLVVTLIGLDFGLLLGGVLFIENVFGIPGLGYLSVTSIQELDYPLATGIVIFSAIVVVGVNTIVDIVHAALDPRVAL